MRVGAQPLQLSRENSLDIHAQVLQGQALGPDDPLHALDTFATTLGLATRAPSQDQLCMTAPVPNASCLTHIRPLRSAVAQLALPAASMMLTNKPQDIDLKTRRKISNRESARRARARRTAEVKDLKQQVQSLQQDKARLTQELKTVYLAHYDTLGTLMQSDADRAPLPSNLPEHQTADSHGV